MNLQTEISMDRNTKSASLLFFLPTSK